MAGFSSILLFLLSAKLAVAQQASWQIPTECTQSSLAAEIGSERAAAAAHSYDITSFCSSYVGFTSYDVSLVITSLTTTTETIIYRSEAYTMTTTTNMDPTTVTVLCPTPTTSMICHWGGYVDGSHKIQDASLSYINGDCQQLCLRNPQCKSWQIIEQAHGYITCNLFNVPVTIDPIYEWPSGGVYIYDRDCPDLLPEGCKASSITQAPIPTPTSAPSLPARAGVAKRDDFPTFLDPYLMWWDCSCIITSVTTKTLSTTSTFTTWPKELTTMTPVWVNVKTQHPGWKTVYTNVPS